MQHICIKGGARIPTPTTAVITASATFDPVVNVDVGGGVVTTMGSADGYCCSLVVCCLEALLFLTGMRKAEACANPRMRPVRATRAESSRERVRTPRKAAA